MGREGVSYGIWVGGREGKGREFSEGLMGMVMGIGWEGPLDGTYRILECFCNIFNQFK